MTMYYYAKLFECNIEVYTFQDKTNGLGYQKNSK